MKTIRITALFASLAFCTCMAMAQKTITVKSAEQLINAIGPDRTIIIDSKEALDITSVLNYYSKIGKVTESATYYYEGEEMYYEQPEIEEEEGEVDEEYDNSQYPPEPGMDEEVDEEEQPDEDDIKMRNLVGFRPENLKAEKYKAKADGKVLQYVYLLRGSDGIGLEIRNCPNLTIKSKKDKATLLSTPRYSNVIEFTHCANLKLQDLVMGHTLEGHCENGVIRLNVCQDAQIDNCDLFGCGTEGFILDYCQNISIRRTNVHDCSYYTLHITGCKSVTMTDCYFYRNRRYTHLNCAKSTDVTFQGCTFESLQGKLFNLSSPCYFEKCQFINCQMQHSQPSQATNAVLKNCTTIER